MLLAWDRITFVDFNNDNLTLYAMDDVSSTIIPSYYNYEHMMAQASKVNPFNVDWLKYIERVDGRHIHPQDLSYLHDILDVLWDQEILWGVDDMTSNSEIFSRFKLFVEAFKRFYDMVLNGGLKRMVLLDDKDIEAYANTLPIDWGVN